MTTEIIPLSFEYFEVDEDSADIVLIVDLSAPPLTGPDSHRFPLKHNPGARLPGIANGSRCWRACGPEGWYGGSISLSGPEQPNEAVIVQVLLDWGMREQGKGQADGEVVVPWLGETRQNLGNGVTVHARIHQVR